MVKGSTNSKHKPVYVTSFGVHVWLMNHENLFLSIKTSHGVFVERRIPNFLLLIRKWLFVFHSCHIINPNTICQFDMNNKFGTGSIYDRLPCQTYLLNMWILGWEAARMRLGLGWGVWNVERLGSWFLVVLIGDFNKSTFHGCFNEVWYWGNVLNRGDLVGGVGRGEDSWMEKCWKGTICGTG